jgi:hypothetical protein
MRESIRANDRQSHRGLSPRVGHLDDRHPIVLPEHPVVALKAATNGLHQPPDGRCPVRRAHDELFDGLAAEAEQSEVFRHHNHPLRRVAYLTDLAISIAPTAFCFNPGPAARDQHNSWASSNDQHGVPPGLDEPQRTSEPASGEPAYDSPRMSHRSKCR